MAATSSSGCSEIDDLWIREEPFEAELADHAPGEPQAVAVHPKQRAPFPQGQPRVANDRFAQRRGWIGFAQSR